jgi:metal-sulfur cluster biosynthetic enzyme
MNSNELKTPSALAAALRKVFDPETGINIVDMGLVYGIEMKYEAVAITLTYSTPACPMGAMIQQELIAQVNEDYPGLKVEIVLTFEPAWNPGMISKAALDSF